MVIRLLASLLQEQDDTKPHPPSWFISPTTAINISSDASGHQPAVAR